jgi:GNAT superfamily N-acetyltransferase
MSLQELIKTFGKENLVDILFKNGKEYYTFFLNETNKFRFITYSEESKPVSICTAEKINEINDENKFVYFPNIKKNKSIFITDFITSPFYIKKGFATNLLEKIINEFQERKIIHISGFSNEGLNALHKKYLKKGYKKARINKKNMPKDLQNFSNWLYKNYK